MEREFIFKAKRVIDNEWIIGNIIIDIDGNKSILPTDTIKKYHIIYVI